MPVEIQEDVPHRTHLGNSEEDIRATTDQVHKRIDAARTALEQAVTSINTLEVKVDEIHPDGDGSRLGNSLTIASGNLEVAVSDPIQIDANGLKLRTSGATTGINSGDAFYVARGSSVVLVEDPFSSLTSPIPTTMSWSSLKTNYVVTDLDTTEEIVAAMNNLGSKWNGHMNNITTKLNLIRTALIEIQNNFS